MVDLNSELRSTLLDSGVTISDQLADERISWGINAPANNLVSELVAHCYP